MLPLLAKHVAGPLVPRLQVLGPEEVYPASQVILQESPLAKVPLQLPIPPLATETLLGMLHPLASHVGALLKFPRAQVIGPEEVYDVLQLIWQESPLAKVPVQLPIPPLATEKLLGAAQL